MDGWRERWWRDAVLYSFNGKCLASTVLGGGDCDGALFLTVGDSFSMDGMDQYVKRRMENLGIHGSPTVFMTKVDVSLREIREGRDHLVVAIAGLSHPSCPGELVSPSTINVLTLVKATPMGNAMADLFRLVVEAKAVASFSLGLKCGDQPSPGTVSDAVAVAFLGGRNLRFAGLGTKLGDQIYVDVINAIKSAAERWIRTSPHQRSS